MLPLCWLFLFAPKKFLISAKSSLAIPSQTMPVGLYLRHHRYPQSHPDFLLWALIVHLFHRSWMMFCDWCEACIWIRSFLILTVSKSCSTVCWNSSLCSFVRGSLCPAQADYSVKRPVSALSSRILCRSAYAITDTSDRLVVSLSDGGRSGLCFLTISSAVNGQFRLFGVFCFSYKLVREPISTE